MRELPTIEAVAKRVRKRFTNSGKASAIIPAPGIYRKQQNKLSHNQRLFCGS